MCLFAPASRAEFFASLYGGWVTTPDTDVRLKQPGNTDLKFQGVSWDSQSFQEPLYYGAKLGYWFSSAPNWGTSLEFTHAKMIADLDQMVNVSGVRAGTAVNGPEPLSDTFQHLEFTHGYNLLTLNVQHRWFLGQPQGRSFWSRLQPYVGTGAGAAIPHAEVTAGNATVSEYQAAGFVWQGFAGLNVDVVKHVSVFGEYKATYADMTVDFPAGGSVQIDPWSHHLVFGITISLGSRGKT